MTFRLKMALAAALVAAPCFAYAAEPTVAGFWEAKDDDGNPAGWFLFSEKEEVWSARLVKGFKKPGDDKPVQKTCTKCTGEKKGAQIMGLTLFWGMKREGLKYRDGSVLDPRDGSVYHALMNLSADGQDLEVRGYLGISMFGKSQTWHRLPDDAMKKDEIPREVLAGDTPDKKKPDPDKKKAHDAAADKSKHKKDKAKAEKPEAEPADADAAPAEKAQ